MATLQDLTGALTLKQAWPKIEANDVALNAELAEQGQLIDALQTGDSGPAANAARVSTPYDITYATLKDRVDATDTRAIALTADVAQVQASKANLTYVDAQLVTKAATTYVDAAIAGIGNGSPKGVYATLVALQTAFPTGTTGIYVVTADGHWYYWNGSAWTSGGTYQGTEIADESIGTDQLIDSLVTHPKLSDDVVSFIRNSSPALVNVLSMSSNFFDKDNVIIDKYVNTSGVITTSTDYTLTDYIEIEPDTDYIFKHIPFAAAFYTSDKTYISSLMVASITTPVNAKYVRFGTAKWNMDSQQLCIGTVLPTYEAYFREVASDLVKTVSMEDGSVTIPKLDQTVVDMINDRYKPIDNLALLKHLENPHKKTKITLYGDSITHGSGATGFSQDGALIAGTGTFGVKYRDNFDSLSWANDLRRWMDIYFNKDVYVYPLNDVEVARTSGVAAYEDIYVTMGSSLIDSLEFDFYGTSIEISYVKNTNFGIFDVYMDDVLHTTVDSYNTSKAEAALSITGLTDGQHTVKIISTNTKNASSSGNSVVVRRCMVKKYVTIDNLGCSGYGGAGIYSVLKANLATTDNFIFIMSGTNDRGQVSPQFVYGYLKLMLEYILAHSPDSLVVLMSANPAAASEYTNPAYIFHQADIDMVTGTVADEYQVQHISHFKVFWEQCEMRDILLSQLVGDGLHPNDAGHNLMFKTILRESGLAIKAL